MKITLYVNPSGFSDYLCGEIAMFHASLQPKEGYNAPIVVRIKDYTFEKVSPLPVFRVRPYVAQSTGPR